MKLLVLPLLLSGCVVVPALGQGAISSVPIVLCGDFVDTHKGRHFTPQFNRFRAETFFAELLYHGVPGPAETAEPGP